MTIFEKKLDPTGTTEKHNIEANYIISYVYLCYLYMQDRYEPCRVTKRGDQSLSIPWQTIV